MLVDSPLLKIRWKDCVINRNNLEKASFQWCSASTTLTLACAHARILGYIGAFTMSIILENLDSTRKVIVSADRIILHGGIVSTILRLHIVRSKKEIVRLLYMRMLASKTSSWVTWIKQKRRTDSQNYRLFCACLRMLQSTGTGGLGTVKMFQALCAQSTVFFCPVVKLLLSIYRAGSSWLTGPMKVNLKHMRLRTL